MTLISRPPRCGYRRRRRYRERVAAASAAGSCRTCSAAVHLVAIGGAVPESFDRDVKGVQNGQMITNRSSTALRTVENLRRECDTFRALDPGAKQYKSQAETTRPELAKMTDPGGLEDRHPT
jgi:hypothetical protein